MRKIWTLMKLFYKPWSFRPVELITTFSFVLFTTGAIVMVGLSTMAQYGNVDRLKAQTPVEFQAAKDDIVYLQDKTRAQDKHMESIDQRLGQISDSLITMNASQTAMSAQMSNLQQTSNSHTEWILWIAVGALGLSKIEDRWRRSRIKGDGR